MFLTIEKVMVMRSVGSLLRSASVTALQDTRLLGLDRDALYELMSAHPTVLRGLIHVLCGRLRAKGKRS